MTSLGDHARVLKYKLAVARLRGSDEPLQLAHAARHLGDAYAHAGRPELAQPCYVEALAIYRSRDDRRPLDLANALRSFAVLRDESGSVEGAARLWQEAHDLYASLGVKAGVAESAARLALLSQRRGEPHRGREWLDEARREADLAGDAETQRYVRAVVARIEVEQ